MPFTPLLSCLEGVEGGCEKDRAGVRVLAARSKMATDHDPARETTFVFSLRRVRLVSPFCGL